MFSAIHVAVCGYIYIMNYDCSVCEEIVQVGQFVNKLKKILESVSESKVFSDISYDYTIAPVIDSINSSSVLTHNVWHISDDEVKNLSKGKYRLILPYNDDPNVQ